MKMKLKKLISLLTILCMVLSLAACGDKAKTKDDTKVATDKNTVEGTELKSDTESTPESETDADISSPETESDGDVLTPESESHEDVSSPEEPKADTDDVLLNKSEIDGGDLSDTEESPDSFDISTDESISESIDLIVPGDTVDSDIATDDVVCIEPIDPEKPTEDVLLKGVLTAGEWNDNENYDFLLNLISDQGTYSEYVSAWKYNLIKKLDVIVSDNNGPANNIPVTLTDNDGNVVATTYTDIDGCAYIYVNTSKGAPKKCNATLNGETKSFDLDASSYAKTNEIIFYSEAKEVTKLDLCFVIDTTGSMSDELIYLQAELEDVIKTVSKDSAVDIRLSVNFYRDEGDEYVTKIYDFSSDIPDMITILNQQLCAGGGDYEEAVHTVLDEAVNTLSWREDATKLMFFVLDAPAHREQNGVIESISNSLTTATEKGIRIIPIASSGVDKYTEFMLRGFSVITNGTYIFLTDHSGIGDSHIEPSIGEYDVEKLNELLVDVIMERILYIKITIQ